MNLTAGYLQSVACQLHPGQNILQACTEVDCTYYPFLCRICLQDQNQLTQHQSHGNSIKPYDEFLLSISKHLSVQQTTIVNNYKEIFVKPENANILKSLSESDEHLGSLEKFVKSQKHNISNDFKQIIEEIQFTLNTTQRHMFERLDDFFQSYKANLISLKEIAQPLNLILTKFKYYANINNLRTKVGCENLQSRSSLILKIKNCLCVAKFLEQVDKNQQVDKISKAFTEINKALDSLPQYKNDSLNKSFEEVSKILQLFFTTNLVVPDIQIIGPFIPIKLKNSPKNDQTSIFDISLQSQSQQVENGSKITFNEDISILDNKDQLGKSQSEILDESLMEDQVVVEETISIFQRPEAVFINDSRSTEHIVINQLIANPQNRKPQNFKFKIKKKLTLDIHISAMCLISQNLLGIGGKEGSIKLLDLTTNKVSFYPNAFITHFDEVVCLTSLKQPRNSSLNKMVTVNVPICRKNSFSRLTSPNRSPKNSPRSSQKNPPPKTGRYMLRFQIILDKGNRLASASLDTNIIIWTLGENNIPYPERKLVGFDKHIVRMVDLEDGSYLIAANYQGDIHVVNYHDNRVPFTFKAKQPTNIIELFYMSKLERFLSVSSQNQIQVYQLGFKQMQIFQQAQKLTDDSQNTTLLMNCELDQTIQGPNVGTITSCLAVELNESFTICYGNNQGVIACYDFKKNQMIANIQLFNSQILELASFKSVFDSKLKKQGFLLTVVGEGEVNIKGILITQDEKITKLEQFGELLEKCLGTSSKYIIQTIQKSGVDGRAAIASLNANQRDISIMELM